MKASCLYLILVLSPRGGGGGGMMKEHVTPGKDRCLHACTRVAGPDGAVEAALNGLAGAAQRRGKQSRDRAGIVVLARPVAKLSIIIGTL